MKFRGKRQAVRKMTVEQEAAMVMRQLARMLDWLDEREKWCPLVEIRAVRDFFPNDLLKDREEIYDALSEDQ